ncbi:hypothetical protein [Helicobacter sp. T3_23-1056]
MDRHRRDYLSGRKHRGNSIIAAGALITKNVPPNVQMSSYRGQSRENHKTTRKSQKTKGGKMKKLWLEIYGGDMTKISTLYAGKSQFG